MPDYATHQKINASILLLFTTISLILMVGWGKEITINHVIFAVSFICSSWILTPDLDTKSTPYYNWLFLRYGWSIIQKFTKHRGILHNWVFSPILLTLPITVVLLYNHFSVIECYKFIGIYAGIAAQIEIHIVADMIKDRIKKNN